MTKNDHVQGQRLQDAYEPHPDPHTLAAASSTGSSDSNNNDTDVDYAPDHSRSLPIPASRTATIAAITRLYSGSASEDDMLLAYAPEAVYDDPWSYCDTRRKIAGQWWGIPKVFSSSRTLATEVVKSDERELVFKMRQEYVPRVVGQLPGGVGKMTVDSLVSLGLDAEGKVRYHKDMWNEKDYSHEGLGKLMKELNGDHLTKVTKPPKSL